MTEKIQLVCYHYDKQKTFLVVIDETIKLIFRLYTNLYVENLQEFYHKINLIY